MAVQIPPWLNIDPIEPARIELQARSRRAANAAAERRAQLEEARLFAQQQMMYARLAAQERADQRKEQVLRETRDQRLAQQAANLEFRRQMAMQTNQRQMQQLRLREQQVERQAATSSRQLLGMRQLEEDLKRMPLEEALAKNAANLFSDRPERLASAMRQAQVPGAPQPFTAGGISGVYNRRTGAPSFPPRAPAELGPEAFQSRDILDPEGRPIGIRAIPGRGAARVLPGQMNLRPSERINAIKSLIALTQNKLDFEAKKVERPALIQRRDELEKELEELLRAPERVAGKEDEAVRPEGEEDFLLPPTGAEEEGMAEEELGEAELMEQELEEEEPEEIPEEEMELEEAF